MFGTPGGDSGEFLLALSTFFQLGGADATDTLAVLSLFQGFLQVLQRPFYMHMDLPSMSNLVAQIKAFYPAVANLSVIPPAYQAAAFTLVVNASNIGCGHLKLLLAYPDLYQTPVALTTNFIKAYYDFMWNSNMAQSKLDFEILTGIVQVFHQLFFGSAFINEGSARTSYQ